MKKFQKYIPNFLTSMRIFFTPIVIYLGLTNKYIFLIIIASLIAFTDFLDGYLARKWKVTTSLGKKLDMIADKCLAFGLLIILVAKNSLFYGILILECLIAMINLFFYFKKKMLGSLMVGRIKTWFIFITILFGFLKLLYPVFPVKIFVFLTIFWQILTLFCYLHHGIFYDEKKRAKNYQEFLEFADPILSHPEMQKRKQFEHHIHESVYDHILKVSFDCYQIGKHYHLDYKSLTTAALLHDFYEKPWQYDMEKKKFLEKHAFTHAKNAVKNAKKIYGSKIVTPKIEKIMITHMFPVNKKIPRSKEAWILTLVDKADSIDFLLHPLALLKIFLKIPEEKNETKK